MKQHPLNMSEEQLDELARNAGFSGINEADEYAAKEGISLNVLINPYLYVYGVDSLLLAAFEHPEHIGLIEEAYEHHLDAMANELQKRSDRLETIMKGE